jgi:hypothetical protein
MMADHGQDVDFVEKIGSKCLVRVADLYKGSVSQLKGGGYSSKSGKMRHIHPHESAYSINQIAKE